MAKWLPRLELLHEFEFTKEYEIVEANSQLTVTLDRQDLLGFAKYLTTTYGLSFLQLLDVCGVDYLHYGQDEWSDHAVSSGGFSRAVVALDEKDGNDTKQQTKRFGVVYHLLSIEHNVRLRLKVMLAEDDLEINTVTEIWPAADWFEREAFDLFGIIFLGHPDLRRILTDYGFVGHPFRKDFPLIGEVEMRYDAKEGKCIYEEVSITPRVLTPKIIRDDSRYHLGQEVSAVEEE